MQRNKQKCYNTQRDYNQIPPVRLFFNSDKQPSDAIERACEISGICPSNPFEASLRNFPLASLRGFLEVPAPSLLSCSLSLLS